MHTDENFNFTAGSPFSPIRTVQSADNSQPPAHTAFWRFCCSRLYGKLERAGFGA